MVLSCDIWVRLRARNYLYDSLSEIPANHVGLVLGTSKRVKSGGINLFFQYRIKAAAQLYHAGKVRHFILSGDNRLKSYNEAQDMKEALVSQGVPDSVITLDYAGFRTLDSIIRSKEVFGQQRITIISQKFHNQRALFIARAKGLDAIAFNAQSVRRSYAPMTYIREYLARVNAVLDVYILHTQPHFLGDPILLPSS